MSAANELPPALAWDPPDCGDLWELIDGTTRAMASAAPPDRL
jgi:hypothetical protein